MTRRRASGDRLVRGQIVTARPGADFAQANQPVTVLEVLPGDRARIAYGAVTDLIVPAGLLQSYAPGARATDPVTSHRAAAAQTDRKLTAGQRAALHALAVAGSDGLTDFELAERTERKQTSIGVRRGELVKAGLVVATDEVRPSDTQSDALVWRITDLGVTVWTDLNQQRGAA